ncbi:MAG: DUF115 domain-containing protein [Treponema sp.]|jgi:hypothetical protein|nr:DUF115 domain-containing protein [Treponema sp.]
MMTFWEKNYQILKSNYPALALQLAAQLEKNNAEFDGTIDIRETPSGNPTMVINDLFIHSPRFPDKEAEKLVSGLQDTNPALVLGIGLGYILEALIKNYPEKPIIIAEKHFSLFRKALETRDFATILSRPNIIWFIGGEARGIIGALEILGGYPEIIPNRNLMQIDSAWYEEIEACVKAWSNKDEINNATLRRFGKRWVRNLGTNIEAIRDIPGIKYLEGAAADFPVFLAAAGPSLDETIPYLKEIAARCIIVAVDTSLRFLLAHGIDPDFVVMVDPQYWNARHLDRCLATKSCLIAESAVYPGVLRHSFRRAFLCSSLFPLGRFIEDRMDPKGVLGAGGSVATSAWDFARILGTKDIWISGLDLAFPGLKTHFKGALFEERALAESTRYVPAETKSVNMLFGGQPFFAPGANGEKTLTDKRLSLYASWFDQRFLQYPSIKNRSFSQKGLFIRNMEIAQCEEILNLPKKRDTIDTMLAERYAKTDDEYYNESAIKERNMTYVEARNTLVGGLRQLFSMSESAADTARRAWNNESNLTPAKKDHLLRSFDEVNRSISNSEVKDVASFLFPPLHELEKILKTPKTETFKRHLELSWKLYNSLAEAASYNLTYIEKASN